MFKNYRAEAAEWRGKYYQMQLSRDHHMQRADRLQKEMQELEEENARMREGMLTALGMREFD